jgi:Fe2+ or Zn2+ uptake regulation protein/O6-methylguanine-DNA--protein-cysteine methyltransferase
VTLSADAAGNLLRDRGMRSTPQRRAILSVFGGGRTEHLSADEIYARAMRSLTDLSRATVYATLADFSEVGLLSSFGTPEPVRYERNFEPHAHFTCRLCLRIFDLQSGQQDPSAITDPGFTIERIETRVEGICDECNGYNAGLRAGAAKIIASGPVMGALSAGAAVAETSSPLGQLLLASTPQGLTRVAFDDHADVANLRQHASKRRGSHAARDHLTAAIASLDEYFSGHVALPECPIDWEHLESRAPTLLATREIPYATHRSYSDLGQGLDPRELGNLIGRNPIPLFMPCHRVWLGTETPRSFVGGTVRRQWLEAHEQQSRSS